MTNNATNVTVRDVFDEVRRLANERPDYIYNNPTGSVICNYVEHDGTPGCIFGQALTRLLPDAHLTEGIKASQLLKELGFILTATERQWADKAQREQDQRRPWGIAVSKADAAYGPVAA